MLLGNEFDRKGGAGGVFGRNDYNVPWLVMRGVVYGLVSFSAPYTDDALITYTQLNLPLRGEIIDV